MDLLVSCAIAVSFIPMIMIRIQKKLKALKGMILVALFMDIRQLKNTFNLLYLRQKQPFFALLFYL